MSALPGPDLGDALRAFADDLEAFGIDVLPAPPRAAPDAKEPGAPAAAPAAAADVAAVDSLERIAAEVAACTRCALAGTRTRVVPGQGAASARLLFVGEAPGEDEDRQGLAFVGASGQLLTRMVLAMGFTRDEVFIANVLKCRPPGNRDPRPEEVACCLPFLKRQVALLRPTVIVTLGGHAARALLGLPPTVPVGRLRGRVHDCEGTPVVATYHPSYLLRSPHEKAKAWSDLKIALGLLGREPPAR